MARQRWPDPIRCSGPLAGRRSAEAEPHFAPAYATVWHPTGPRRHRFHVRGHQKRLIHPRKPHQAGPNARFLVGLNQTQFDVDLPRLWWSCRRQQQQVTPLPQPFPVPVQAGGRTRLIFGAVTSRRAADTWRIGQSSQTCPFGPQIKRPPSGASAGFASDGFSPRHPGSGDNPSLRQSGEYTFQGMATPRYS